MVQLTGRVESLVEVVEDLADLIRESDLSGVGDALLCRVNLNVARCQAIIAGLVDELQDAASRKEPGKPAFKGKGRRKRRAEQEEDDDGTEN